MRIYKDCDVRGVFGRELMAAEVYRIGQALTTMVSGKFRTGVRKIYGVEV